MNVEEVRDRIRQIIKADAAEDFEEAHVLEDQLMLDLLRQHDHHSAVGEFLDWHDDGRTGRRVRWYA